MRERGRPPMPPTRVLGDGNRIACPLPREIRKAGEPQRQRRPGMTRRACVLTVRGRERAGVLAVVGREAPFGVFDGLSEDALVKEDAGEELVRFEQETFARRLLCHSQRLLDELPRAVVLASHLVQGSKAKQRPPVLVRTAEALRQLTSTYESGLRLWRRKTAYRELRERKHRLERELFRRSVVVVRSKIEHRERVRQVLERFAVREPFERLLRRQPQGDDRTRRIASSDEVFRQLRRDFFRALAVLALEQQPNAEVRLRALPSGKTVVQDLPVEVVGKAVVRIDCAVGPLLLAGALDEPPRV